MSGVTLECLTKVFDDHVVAVDDVDLEVDPGEFLVLVGPSGCGKSTLLRLIAGLEAPTAGRIRVGERDVTDLPPKDRDIAMVFQNYALYPHMSVRENLAFGLRMRKTPRPERERRVRATAEQLGLEAFLDRKPGALSGGQRQRVALGRAIVREPVVFLFDEPLSNLDAKLRVHTRAELVRLHRELGTTMIYVTHDQTEAMTMGQRIAVMHDGRIHQLAPPLAVYDRPANRFVAGFIGSPPMNFFVGRIANADAGGSVCFEADGFTLALDALGSADGGDVVVGGREVALGVRPEHVTLVAPAAADRSAGLAASADSAPPAHAGPAAAAAPEPSAESDACADLRAVVQAVEPLGAETLIYARTHTGAAVIARTDSRPTVRPEEPIGLRIAAARIHLFDAVTGERLSRPPAPAPAGGA